MNDNRNRYTTSSSSSSTSTSFHIPKPQQSLFPLFMAMRDQWNQRKQQQQGQNPGDGVTSSSTSPFSSGGGELGAAPNSKDNKGGLLPKPYQGNDGYFK